MSGRTVIVKPLLGFDRGRKKDEMKSIRADKWQAREWKCKVHMSHLGKNALEDMSLGVLLNKTGQLSKK